MLSMVISLPIEGQHELQISNCLDAYSNGETHMASTIRLHKLGKANGQMIEALASADPDPVKVPISVENISQNRTDTL